LIEPRGRFSSCRRARWLGGDFLVGFALSPIKNRRSEKKGFYNLTFVLMGILLCGKIEKGMSLAKWKSRVYYLSLSHAGCCDYLNL
jgi:hypothetical protein